MDSSTPAQLRFFKKKRSERPHRLQRLNLNDSLHLKP